MDTHLILFFLISAVIYVDSYDSKCHGNRITKVTDELCEKWWSNCRDGSREEKKGCIKLIKEKCPGIVLEMKTIIERSYHRDDMNYETWTYTTQATRQSDKTIRRHYKYKTHPICWDNNGKEPDCNYWWRVANADKAENKHKERCIERILHHCKDRLTLVGTVDSHCVQGCLGSYQVKTVTYKGKDDLTVSYEKQVPARN